MLLFGRVRSYFGWQRGFAADFADEPSKHQLDLINPSFERIMLTRSQELKISGEQKEIVQFACRPQGDVKVLLQLRSSSSAATLSDVGGNRKSGTSHLACQTITLLFWKGRSNPVNAEGHGMTLLPNQEFAKILHVLILFLFSAFTYNLRLITYNCYRGAVQC